MNVYVEKSIDMKIDGMAQGTVFVYNNDVYIKLPFYLVNGKHLFNAMNHRTGELVKIDSKEKFPTIDLIV